MTPPVQVLLDTNIVSYRFRGGLLGLRYDALIGERRAGITWPSLVEFHYGCALQNWGESRRHQFGLFLNQFPVLPAELAIAHLCGELLARRRQAGRQMELADAWIAATALRHEIPLVTHDRDYEGIPGLRIVTLHDTWRVRDDGRPYQGMTGGEVVWQ